MTNTLRFGLIGAANIAPNAMIHPARELDRVEVVGVAARDPKRAKKFAKKHTLPTVWESYDELIASDEINAVYNGLPPSGHHAWTIKALEAGKHVLCEKPFSLTLAEAEEMVATADRTGLVLGEAFHWRYHPLAAHVRELLDAGTIGEVRHVETEFSASIDDRNDVRWQLALGGGSLMDLGCYAVQLNRFAAGAEPEIVTATATTEPKFPGIDVSMRIEVRYPNGITGTITSDMRPAAFGAHLNIDGTAGRIEVRNPVQPGYGHLVTTTTAAGTTTHELPGTKATYYYQLEAFVAAVLDGGAFPTSGADTLATMKVIEDAYAAAGLPPRG